MLGSGRVDVQARPTFSARDALGVHVGDAPKCGSRSFQLNADGDPVHGHVRDPEDAPRMPVAGGQLSSPFSLLEPPPGVAFAAVLRECHGSLQRDGPEGSPEELRAIFEQRPERVGGLSEKPKALLCVAAACETVRGDPGREGQHHPVVALISRHPCPVHEHPVELGLDHVSGVHLGQRVYLNEDSVRLSTLGSLAALRGGVACCQQPGEHRADFGPIMGAGMPDGPRLPYPTGEFSRMTRSWADLVAPSQSRATA